jgi:predicted HTH domain antitoxin
MATHVLQIRYDDAVLLETSLRRGEFEQEAALLLAAKLYEMGRLSSGRAAQLCGMGRVDFLLSMRRVGVPVSNLREEDVPAEVAFARGA